MMCRVYLVDVYLNASVCVCIVYDGIVMHGH